MTQSPTRYIRVVLRSLCAPAATGALSQLTNGGGIPVAALATVPSRNLDTGVKPPAPTVAVPNNGPFFDINGARANLPGAGPGASLVSASDGSCLQSAQYANGLFSGQYMAPVTEYIFPENTLAGNPIIPNNFWHMGFLAYGENGRDGNSTRPVGSVSGQRPW